MDDIFLFDFYSSRVVPVHSPFGLIVSPREANAVFL